MRQIKYTPLIMFKYTSITHSIQRQKVSLITNRFLSISILLGIIFSAFIGCGSQSSVKQASQVCQKSAVSLKQRVGPEFDKLISVTPLPLSTTSQHGCVLTYTKVLEELPGEVTGQYISSSQPHDLAFLIPNFQGQLVISQPPIPTHRKGPVTMEVKLAEIHGGGPPEVMIEEREIGHRNQIHGLRIFLYAEGVPVPKEIFSERMSVKSSAGIERPAEILIGNYEDLPALFLKSSLTKRERIYMWHESLQQYKYDLSATQRHMLSKAAAKQSLRANKDLSPRSIKTSQKGKHEPSSLVDLLQKKPQSSRPSTLEAQKQPNENPTTSTDLAETQQPQTPDLKRRKKEDDKGSKSEQKVTTVNEFLEGL